MIKEEYPQYLVEINSIDKIIDLYEELGNNNYIGENISMSEHSIQACLKAKEYGEDNKSQVAALLHDLGHIIGQKYGLKAMGSLGTVEHELIGAQVLHNIGFHYKVTEIVKNHVNAKRYLVTKNPEYYDKLSEASKGTLVHQGGKMNEEEFNKFQNHEFLQLILKMRNWDEAAKVENMQIPQFKEFKALMEECVITN